MTPPLNYKHSDEVRKKISQKMMGHVVTDETKRKMSKAHLGQPPGRGAKGKHWTLSEETRSRMVSAQKLRRSRDGAWTAIPHNTVVEQEIGRLKNTGAKILFSDIVGSSRPDVIYFANGKIVALDFKTRQGKLVRTEVEFEVNV